MPKRTVGQTVSGNRRLDVEYRAMHPLHWIYNNREFLQAVSGIAIGLLTLILIVLNLIYVRANWKTMRLMEADVRFRTQPLPSLDMTVGTAGMTQRVLSWLTLTTSNAPLRVISVEMEFTFKNGLKELRRFEGITDRYLPPGQELRMEDAYDGPDHLQDYLTNVMYTDLAGFSQYSARFGKDKTVIITIPPRLTLLARAWRFLPWVRR